MAAWHVAFGYLFVTASGPQVAAPSVRVLAAFGRLFPGCDGPRALVPVGVLFLLSGMLTLVAAMRRGIRLGVAAMVVGVFIAGAIAYATYHGIDTAPPVIVQTGPVGVHVKALALVPTALTVSALWHLLNGRMLLRALHHPGGWTWR